MWVRRRAQADRRTARRCELRAAGDCEIARLHRIPGLKDTRGQCAPMRRERVLAAFRAAAERSAGLFVREALRAEADRALAERLLAARRACLASAR